MAAGVSSAAPGNMAQRCLSHPGDQVALRDATTPSTVEITYADLAERVDRLARGLARRVQPGDRVGVLLGQDPWCAASHLATWKMGAISVPLFRLFQRDALASRINDAGLSYVLTDAAGAAQLGDLAQPLIASELGEAGPALPFASADKAIIIYTSGTTGRPKGALHGHGLLEGHIPGVSLSHNHLGAPGDCLWTPADWAWIGGLFDVLMPGLALGVPVVATRMAKFDPAACAALVAKARIRNIFFPPTALRMLKTANMSISGLRSVATGGEPLGTEMLAWGERAFGLTINEFYGQTECNMVVSSCAVDFPPRPGSMGKPVPGFGVAVIDAAGEPTTAEGDIAVKRGAPSMMLEYWQRPETTQAAFRGPWLVTGDRGIWDGEYLRFVGREDDVITSAGYRIGPSEIEDCLLTHPDVATCGVVGKPDSERTQIVKAYVVAKRGTTPTEDALKDWVKQRLARHCYPREVEFVDALPMTVTGKVIRKELKARAKAEVA